MSVANYQLKLIKKPHIHQHQLCHVTYIFNALDLIFVQRSPQGVAKQPKKAERTQHIL